MTIGIYSLDRTNFLVKSDEATWLLSLYEALPRVHVSLANVEDYEPVLGSFCLSHEVWGTTLLSWRPSEVLLEEIAQTIYLTSNVDYPLELALNFGGSVLGESVNMLVIGAVH